MRGRSLRFSPSLGPVLPLLALAAIFTLAGCKKASPVRIELVDQLNFPPGKLYRTEGSTYDVAAVVRFRWAVNDADRPAADATVQFDGAKPFQCTALYNQDAVSVLVPRGYALPPKKATCSIRLLDLGSNDHGTPGRIAFLSAGTWTLKELPPSETFIRNAHPSPLLRAFHTLNGGSPAIGFEYRKGLPPGTSISVIPSRFSHISSLWSLDSQVGNLLYASPYAGDQDAVRCTATLHKLIPETGTVQLRGCRLVAELGSPYVEIPVSQIFHIGSSEVFTIPAQKCKVLYPAEETFRCISVAYRAGEPGRLASYRMPSLEYEGPDLSAWGLGRVDTTSSSGKRFPKADREQPLRFGDLPPLTLRYRGEVTENTRVFEGDIPIEPKG